VLGVEVDGEGLHRPGRAYPPRAAAAGLRHPPRSVRPVPMSPHRRAACWHWPTVPGARGGGRLRQRAALRGALPALKARRRRTWSTLERSQGAVQSLRVNTWSRRVSSRAW
jgi:hypothetical protein